MRSKDPIPPSLQNFEIKPGGYSTKFTAAIDPAMRSDEAGMPWTRTLLAIGSLIGTLDREKQTAKGAFAKTFNGYASRANQELFQELVAGPIPATPSRSSNDLP
jgi:hypothetical protein